MYTMWGDYCVLCGYDRNPLWGLHKSVRRPVSLLVATAGLALVAWPLLDWAGLWLFAASEDGRLLLVFPLLAGVGLFWLALDGWQGRKPADTDPPEGGPGDGTGRYPGLL